MISKNLDLDLASLENLDPRGPRPKKKAETFRCFYRGMVDSIIAHFLLKRRPELDDRNPLEQYAAWVGTAARKGLAEIPHQAGIQACLLIVTQFYTH